MTSAKKPVQDPAANGRMARRFVAAALTLVVAAALVLGIAWLGKWALRGIGPQERYSTRFADIECNPPPGYDRAGFLAEVRYISDLPESFQSLDPDLNAKLTAVFLAHPWIEEVKEVALDSTGVVRVTLVHREPMLALPIAPGEFRVVDRHAVLLPVAASPAGLAVLESLPATPPSRDGEVWHDATVQRAVELVAAHHPVRLELTLQGWRLTMADGRTLIVEK